MVKARPPVVVTSVEPHEVGDPADPAGSQPNKVMEPGHHNATYWPVVVELSCEYVVEMGGFGG